MRCSASRPRRPRQHRSSFNRPAKGAARSEGDDDARPTLDIFFGNVTIWGPKARGHMSKLVEQGTSCIGVAETHVPAERAIVQANWWRKKHGYRSVCAGASPSLRAVNDKSGFSGGVSAHTPAWLGAARLFEEVCPEGREELGPEDLPDATAIVMRTGGFPHRPLLRLPRL